ncbi:hypothetical protein ACFWP3_31850 [Streptomyces sp. NPDC058525]|uniref:hypothetical protein n=1 Tax=unclassified Streptomyces TaxID=2593676 RepID=UPI00364C0A09
MSLRTTAAVFAGALAFALPTAGPALADDDGGRGLGTLHYRFIEENGGERRSQIRPADNDTCYLLTDTSSNAPAIDVVNRTRSRAYLYDNRGCAGRAERVLEPGQRARNVSVIAVYFKPVGGRGEGGGGGGGGDWNGGGGGGGDWNGGGGAGGGDGREDQGRGEQGTGDQGRGEQGGEGGGNGGQGGRGETGRGETGRGETGRGDAGRGDAGRGDAASGETGRQDGAADGGTDADTGTDTGVDTGTDTGTGTDGRAASAEGDLFTDIFRSIG